MLTFSRFCFSLSLSLLYLEHQQSPSSTWTTTHERQPPSQPLENIEAFRLGNVDGETHLRQIGGNELVNWDGVQNMAWKILTLGQGKGKGKDEEEKKSSTKKSDKKQQAEEL